MDQRELFNRLIAARMTTLEQYPFFGRLALNLRLGLSSSCGTAFTDMRRVVFDVAFLERLSDGEVQFVLLHEIMHCALKHCTRGMGKHPFLYNVACDIVVNSILLEMLHQPTFTVDGEVPMHLAPDGTEGRKHSADEVYHMLLQMAEKEIENRYGKQPLDNHSIWPELNGPSGNGTLLEDLWSHHMQQAGVSCGDGSGIPQFLARFLAEIDHAPRTNWRQILQDFIRFDKSDYDFFRPDRRYSGDVILPSFCEEMDGAKVENLWFLVDTSGSVSDQALTVAYEEIQQATDQLHHVSGWLSFFDTQVSDPVPFASLEEILAITPTGGGGTSFYAIFRKLQEFAEQDELPVAIIILTDGYAPFPPEEKALGVPVIWVIVDSDVEPPWGTSAHIRT